MIRGRSAESPALAAGLFNAADPKPNADFIFVRLFRVDRADRTQSQQAGGNFAGVQRSGSGIMKHLFAIAGFLLAACGWAVGDTSSDEAS